MSQQLKSCHCSSRRSVRERRHDRTDSDEEDFPSADDDRLARLLGGTPNARPTLNAAGSLHLGNAVRYSVSPELPESIWHGASSSAGPGNNNAVPPMNTTVPSALQTTNPTITPSSGPAYTISVTDARLQTFSSDVLPIDILQTLGRKFRLWIANPAFNWATVQSSTKSRNCIEARLAKKKSDWKDGSDYACAMCNQRMNLCMVVDSGEQVLLLPRKTAEDAGAWPGDATYWMR